MAHKYKLNPQSYETKWQEKWLKDKTYQPDLKGAKKPYYNLMMFPYPSAEGLHVGNMYAFTGVDINGRFQRMRGNDVIEPIGLDGFGIHSENYAIKVGKNPKEQAKISENNFYRQLSSIGNGFAWENRLETYDPDYYKWTQWIFIQMFKKGLAYRKKSLVNFCPSCKTVLSDEQVIDGHCERCKTEVEKRDMEQWFFKITDYAKRLLDNTYKENFHWTDKVKIGQQNWIGKKEGINITYSVVDGDGKNVSLKNKDLTITTFTTRPDTNYGATFIVVGPEHPFVTQLINSVISVDVSTLKEIKAYVDKVKNTSEQERIASGRKKTGVFTTYYAVNNLTGYKMPIYVTDFVLGHVGTGAVVGVPGHDLRDFEFAKAFNLEIIRVVVGADGDSGKITHEKQVQEKEGTMINSAFLNGKHIHEATKLIMDYLEQKRWGERVTTYKLRDWCISRQRYWGAPIPMIYCQKCSWQPVADSDLPVLLPDLTDWKPEGTGKGPLAKLKEFVEVACPTCGAKAQRETDVCDTFLDSSWYFLRYPSISDETSGQVPWNAEITRKWLPVTQYIGGAEHTVLHLLYARFVTMVFYDLGLVDFDEPFAHFFAHGLIIKDGAKMSKSRGNVVIPDEYIAKYGADTLRTYLMFLGPFDMGGDFRDSGIAGMYKFLGRVWRLVEETQSQKGTKTGIEHDKLMHKTIKDVTLGLEKFHYNTSIAKIMEYVNALTDRKDSINEENIKNLLLLLAPFAPHMTEELYQRFFADKKSYRSIHVVAWPTYEEKYLLEDAVTIVVQVNGKLRDTLVVSILDSSNKEEIVVRALASEKVKKHTQGATIKKSIFVPGKLLNLVV